MPDYSKAKLYMITSSQTDKIYIGSTIKRLCERMSQHRSYYQKYMVKQTHKIYEDYFDIVQFSDARIQLLENVSCKDKCELNQKLQQRIEILKDKVCNRKPERQTREYKPSPHHKKRGRKPKNTTLTPEPESTPESTPEPTTELESQSESE